MPAAAPINWSVVAFGAQLFGTLLGAFLITADELADAGFGVPMRSSAGNHDSIVISEEGQRELGFIQISWIQVARLLHCASDGAGQPVGHLFIENAEPVL